MTYNLPCHNCITFPMCRNVGTYTNGAGSLAFKCEILSNYLTLRSGVEYNVERLYEVYSYCIRGWKEENHVT